MEKTTYNLTLIVLLAGIILSGCNQNKDAAQTNTDNTAQAGKAKTKLDKNKVPKEITNLFYADYPTTTYTDWYGYPAFDYVNDWYDYDPSLYSNDYPETYVIEFATDTTSYKAVYTKGAKKVAIHKPISELPLAISTSISQGTYSTWAIGKDKEEIFKDKDTDQMKVYKVEVTNGTEKHMLYFQPDGKLLKDKKIS